MVGLCPNASCAKGQVISKGFFGVFNFFQKKRTKTCRIVVKTNSFIRFFEEIDDPQNHFEINLPLVAHLRIFRLFMMEKFDAYVL